MYGKLIVKSRLFFSLLCFGIVLFLIGAFTGAKSILLSQNIKISEYSYARDHYQHYTPSFLNKFIFKLSRFKNKFLSTSVKQQALDSDQLKPIYIHHSKTSKGYTLITHYQKAEALLINMQGKVIHRWYKDPHQIWPFHSKKNIIMTKAHIYPDGRLLALYESTNTFLNGIGLALFDEESNLIWEVPAATQKDFVVSEKNFYVLTQGLSNYHGLQSITDSISIISQTGKIKDVIPLYQLFKNSAYVSMIPENSFRNFHCSSLSKIHYSFKLGNLQINKGDLLITIKNLNIIAIISPETWTVKWAMQGLSNKPLYATLISKNSIMVFDSIGNKIYQDPLNGLSRITRISLESLQYNWNYTGQETIQPFTIFNNSYLQLLANENLLITMDNTRVIELNQSKHIVWELELPVNYAHRYKSSDLPFLIR